jgi:hypothetical protein
VRRIVIILALLSSAHSLLGQIETTQFFMTTLPQIVDSNPAFRPKFNYAIGIPGSRFSASYTNNGFTYNDAIRLENGKRIFDVVKWQESLPEKTYIANASSADLLRVGAKVGEHGYFWIVSSAKAMTQLMFPKDIAVLLSKGNAAYVGQTAALAPAAHGMTYWETGVGLSVAPIPKLRIGGKIKRIYGAQSVHTEKSELLLTVDEDYAMTLAADLHVKTSGVQDPSDVFGDYLKNSGWGVDMGATLQVLPRISVAASLVDIGYINWRNNVYDYTLNKSTAKFTFSGLDVQDLLNGNTDDFEQQLDSLGEAFTPEEKQGAEYSMALPAKMYLSGAFDINQTFTLGGLFFTERFNGRTGTGWTTSLNMNVGKWMTTSVSYTVSNRSVNNLGVGLALKFGPVQLYAVGDNVLGMPMSYLKTGYLNNYINSSKVINGRFGLNFTWGWKKAGEDEDDE